MKKRVGINRTVGSLIELIAMPIAISKDSCSSKLSFSALDRSFINKYDLYLRTERNLAPGTIINLTVQLKTIVGEAIADGIITASPFMGYEPVRPKHVQKYLTAEELHRIMTTPLHRQTLYHVRDMFLFSCFTGIPYGDMRLLTKDNLCLAEDGIWWIKSARQKTKIEFEIPLLDLPLQILKKYSGTAPGDKLLPMVLQFHAEPRLKRDCPNLPH